MLATISAWWVNGIEGFKGIFPMGNPPTHNSKCIEIRYDSRSLEIIYVGDTPPLRLVGQN